MVFLFCCYFLQDFDPRVSIKELRDDQAEDKEFDDIGDNDLSSPSPIRRCTIGANAKKVEYSVCNPCVDRFCLCEVTKGEI